VRELESSSTFPDPVDVGVGGLKVLVDFEAFIIVLYASRFQVKLVHVGFPSDREHNSVHVLRFDFFALSLEVDARPLVSTPLSLKRFHPDNLGS